MKDFVRVSCVPEAGLLDVEYRSLHDSVAGVISGQDKRDAILAREGFHDPHGLKFSCDLGGIVYMVSANQGEASEHRICGASPEVSLTVTRGGDKLLSDVVFGDSCNQMPSVMRMTVGDGPHSWRGREAQVCYATGNDTDAPFCDWTFGDQTQFDRHFPLDQNRVRKIAESRVRH